jgi:hypothetical protein
MPKKIKFESFKNQFLINANKTDLIVDKNKWKKFLLNLNFLYEGKDFIISSKDNKDLILKFNINDAKFYIRGDHDKKISTSSGDDIKIYNKDFFNSIVKILATEARFV